MANPRQLFGTDGIRARYGEEPLTEPSLRRLGQAIAATLAGAPQTSRRQAPARILIGRDTRASGPAILHALAAGMASAGYTPVDLGVVTTPGVAYCVRNLGAAAGAVISASHNPAPDNGIKLFGPDGFKLADEIEEAIEGAFYGQTSWTQRAALPGETGPTPGNGSRDSTALADASAHVQAYVEHLIAAGRHHAPVVKGTGGKAGSAPLPFAGRRIAVDCANGAASAIAPGVFRALGADVAEIACAPDGHNINDGCGALHPETLSPQVRDAGADAGVTFDGDGDRVMLLDRRGRVLDGDHMLATLAHALKRRNALPGDLVAGTVMANLGLEQALNAAGMSLLRTAVGDRYVVEAMLRENAALGGEQSGHIIIFERGNTTGDGIFTAVTMLAEVWGAGGSLEGEYERIARHPQVLVNVPVSRKEPFERLGPVQDALRAVEGELGRRGRVLLRYSGTEALARVMVEGVDKNEVARHAERVAAAIRAEIGREP